MVFRGRPDHRRATDVDVLDDLFVRRGRLVRCALEGVQIDDHEVDLSRTQPVEIGLVLFTA
jgi:hypothetical protein